MATIATVLRADGIPPGQLSALKRKAHRMGLTPAMYIQQLIEEDLVLDRRARNTSLDELAAPFRRALKGTSGRALDHIVEAARPKRAARSSKRG